MRKELGPSLLVDLDTMAGLKRALEVRFARRKA